MQEQQGPQLAYLSKQMQLYNKTLTIYTTSPMNNDLPNIEVVVIKAYEVLARCGYTHEEVAMIQSWKVFTRFSDILRVCLQQNVTRATYMDFDIVMLSPTPELFQVPFITVGVWAEAQHALEISNDFFCLTPERLAALTAYMRGLLGRKIRGESKYFYTEFGPAAFSHTQMQGPRGDLLLHPEPNPWSNDREVMGNVSCHYRMRHAHFTGSIRTNLAQGEHGYLRLVEDLRCRTGAPWLQLRPETELPRALAECGCSQEDRAPQPFE